MQAVAAIYAVCVVVVIHPHEHVHIYGDPTNARIYLYKKDSSGEFYALIKPNEGVFVYGGVRCAAAKVTVGSDGDDSTASDELAASAPLPPTVSQGMVVYGGV